MRPSRRCAGIWTCARAGARCDARMAVGARPLRVRARSLFVRAIHPNQTVIIDAGTTCYHAARHLEARTPQVFTNSLPVANLFAAANKLEVVISGGVIYPRLGVLVGPLAVEAFGKIRADVAIMSCGGIAVDGVTNSHGLLIDIQRAMIQAAQRVVFCIDSSKFGRQSISRLCELDAIDVVVTDRPIPLEMARALKKAGVE